MAASPPDRPTHASALLREAADQLVQANEVQENRGGRRKLIDAVTKDL